MCQLTQVKLEANPSRLRDDVCTNPKCGHLLPNHLPGVATTTTKGMCENVMLFEN